MTIGTATGLQRVIYQVAQPDITAWAGEHGLTAGQTIPGYALAATGTDGGVDLLLNVGDGKPALIVGGVMEGDDAGCFTAASG